MVIRRSLFRIGKIYATEKVYQIIAIKEDLWKKNKIPRDLLPIPTLGKIIEILEERYEGTYKVKFAIEYLECPLAEIVNKDIVSSYRKVITDLIPDLIEAVEALDYEKMAYILDSVLYAQPNVFQEMAHYQLEKIFGYLKDGDESSSIYDWGLQQAKSFAAELAGKWVKIDTDKMNASEIKLLVRIACFYEKQEQEKDLI